MFEMQENDGIWTPLNATIQELGSNRFEVTVSWPIPIPGRANMLDENVCRLNGALCRQVVGKEYNMKVTGTTLVLEVLT